MLLKEKAQGQSPTFPTCEKIHNGSCNLRKVYYSQHSDLMKPFKPFLSPKVPFLWTQQLQESKSKIIKSIERGVKIFDLKWKTALTTDFSRTGIGYWLGQKYFQCTSDVPDCCESGWWVTLANSRFLKDAEVKYAPIEGEALAIAWSLEDTKFFTLGCDDLIITTDHIHIVKIFGDHSLDEISNSHLFSFKQRSLPWRFKIVHTPGLLSRLK